MLIVGLVLLWMLRATYAQESTLYPGISIDELTERTYGEGQLDVLETFRTYPALPVRSYATTVMDWIFTVL
jgi:hypothetical protein